MGAGGVGKPPFQTFQLTGVEFYRSTLARPQDGKVGRASLLLNHLNLSSFCVAQ